MIPVRSSVLVIEDDPAISELLTALLINDGYEVVVAASGQDGLNRLDEGGIDLVLLDLMLPDLNGLEVCRRIRSDFQTAHLPILMVTAMTRQRDVTAGFGVGADDYILKPFDAEELLARVHVWARTSHRQQVEQELAQLGAIVTSADDAIVGHTLDGLITSWNPAAERLYGYTAQEAIGRSVMMLIPPQRHGEFWRIMEALRRGEHVKHDETERVRQDGQRIPVSVRISPVTSPAGRLLGAASIARAIRERQQAEEALRQARLCEGQLQGVILATREVVHLLNNDLVTPVGTLELLLRHPALPAELRALVQDAAVGLGRAVEHLQQFQQVSRVETKNTPSGPSLDLERSIE